MRMSGVGSRIASARPCTSSEPTGTTWRSRPSPRSRRTPGDRIGLTLHEIADELAKLPPDRAPARREWARLSRTWTARIDERIGELERLKLGLTECIGCGCLSLDRCRLANPDDRAARLGPGPRYWIGD
jgi:MerR family transcriptional regulator, redox-sensitive transcriptional activator SoxR